MSRTHCLVIVNPRGGRRRGLAILDQVKPVFEVAGWKLDLRVSEYPGHAQEIARNSDVADCRSICVIGGDGTIHEVVNGLMQRARPVSIPLGFIPAGSGNTLHQHLQCLDPVDAARRIVAGKTCRLDAVKVTMGEEVVYCVDLIGWGGVADINSTAECLRRLGRSRYAVAALWHILRAHRRRARVTLDDKIIDDEFLFVIACNTKFTGDGMKLAPRAEIGDGKIDVVLVRRASRLCLLRLFAKMYSGSHLEMKCVEYHQVRSFAVKCSVADPLDLDGEIKGQTPFHAEVVPAAFEVFA
jgi:sphingosine kinase